MKKLYDLNRRWDSLMTEEELDTSEFEKESKNAVLQYAYYIHVEPILRLVPDLMVKARRSAELARAWWTESCRFQETLKGNIKLVKQYLAEMDQLTEEVNRKSREILQKDEELKKTRMEMEILEDTEVTVKKVINEYQDLSKREEVALKKYHDAVVSREATMEEIVSETSATKPSTLSRIESLKDQQAAIVHTLQQLSDVRAYEQQFLLLIDDVRTKMTSSPHVENPKSEVKKKMTDLRNEIAKLTAERREGEKKMALLGSNYAVGGAGLGALGGVPGPGPQPFRRFRPGSHLFDAISAARMMSSASSFDLPAPIYHGAGGVGGNGGDGAGGGNEEEDEDRLLASLSSAASLRNNAQLQPLPQHHVRTRLMHTQEALELLSAKYSSSEEPPPSIEGSGFEESERPGFDATGLRKSEGDAAVDEDADRDSLDGDEKSDGNRRPDKKERRSSEKDAGGEDGSSEDRRNDADDYDDDDANRKLSRLNSKEPLPPLRKPPWKLAYKN